MSYLLSSTYRHAATDAANSCTFFMRVPPASEKRVLIRKLILQGSFDGTAASTQMIAKVERMSAADPTGGSSPVRAKLDTAKAASIIVDAATKGGAILTVGSASFGDLITQLVLSRRAYFSDLYLEFDKKLPLILRPGEGIAIRTGTTAVVGDAYTIYVVYDEADKN